MCSVRWSGKENVYSTRTGRACPLAEASLVPTIPICDSAALPPGHGTPPNSLYPCSSIQLLSGAPHLFPVLGEGRVGPKTQPQVHSTYTLSAVSVSWGLPSSCLQAIFSIHSLNNLLEGAGEACDPIQFFPSPDWEPSTLGGFSPEVRTAGRGSCIIHSQAEL